MDWDLAITHNRDQLLRIIAQLFAMAGLVSGRTTITLPRHLYRAILNILRPAESAVRRLIIIAARGLVLKARAARAAKNGRQPFPHIPTPAVPVFPLIDPRKQFAPADFEWEQVKTVPHIRSFASYEPLVAPLWPPFDPVRQAPGTDDPIKATGLIRRLLSLKSVLDDLPKQARRLARLTARQNLAKQSQKPLRPSQLPPTRPGPPPGFRKRSTREVDYVLREVHALMKDMWAESDTS